MSKKPPIGRMILPVHGLKDILAATPWIARLENSSTICDATKVRSLYPYFLRNREVRDGESDPELDKKREEYFKKNACKNKAAFIYVLLDGSTRQVCMSHLYSQIIGYTDNDEKDNPEGYRFYQWADERYQKLENIGK